MNSENVALPNAGGVLGRVRRFQWITRLPSGRERTVCDTPNGVVFRTMDSAVDAERRENSAGPVVAALPDTPCGVGHDGTFGRYYVPESGGGQQRTGGNDARNACRDKEGPLLL